MTEIIKNINEERYLNLNKIRYKKKSRIRRIIDYIKINYTKNKTFKIALTINVILVILMLILENSSFATTANANSSTARNPMFIRKIKNGFERIQDYILIIATPAAGVSISTGLLMQKFSFGDEEKVRNAKRLIRGSILAYVLILSTKFLLDLIQMILK